MARLPRQEEDFSMPEAKRPGLLIWRPMVRGVLPAIVVLLELSPLIAVAALLKVF